MPLSKVVSAQQIAKGYFWQYIKLKDSDPILVSLKTKGDLVGILKRFLPDTEEFIESGAIDSELKSFDNNDSIALCEKDNEAIATYLRYKHTGLKVSFNKAKSDLSIKASKSLKVIDQNSDDIDNTKIIHRVSSCLSISYPKYLHSYLFGYNDDVNISGIADNTSDLRLQKIDSCVQYIKLNCSTEAASSRIKDCFTDSIDNENNISVADLHSNLINIGIDNELLAQNLLSKAEKNDCIISVTRQNYLSYGKVDNVQLNPDSNIPYIIIKNDLNLDLSFKSFFSELLRSKSSIVLILFLSFFIQILTLATPLLFQQIIDKVIGQQNPSLLPIFIFIMIVCPLMAGILRSSRQIILFEVANKADVRVSEGVLQKLLAASFDFFKNKKQGDLAGRLNEVSSLRSFFTGPAINLILDLLFSVTYLSILLVYNVQLTIISLLPVPIYLLIVFWGAPFYKKLTRQRANKRSALISFLIEIVGGVESIKLQLFKRPSIDVWRRKFMDQQNESLKITVFGAIVGEISGFFAQLSTILILGFGSTLILTGSLTLGELISFRIISGFLTSPLLRLANLWQAYQEAQISMERINLITSSKQESIQGKLITSNDAFSLIINSLTFSYSSKQRVLNDVSFTVLPGSTTGLVGRSGSGKSTIFKLITKLLTPDSGDIYLGTKNLNEISTDSLRESIYCAPQEAHFIEGTIEENVLYGSNSSFDKINEALRMACLDEIVDSPKNILTWVSEGAKNFSGGQRQRIALARMFLRKPKFLLLDEATSSLDPITEKTILSNIREFLPDTTVLYITHRVSLTLDADRVIVLDQGQIVANGSPSFVKNECDVYSNLLKEGV